MAYIQPVVMVFQEYASTSVATQTASLNPCIIGPCYHILDAIEDEVLAYAGDLGAIGMEDVMFPNNYPGAKIVDESVVFRLKDVIAALNVTPLSSTGVLRNIISFADASAYPDDVAVGDYVTITDADTSEVLINRARVTAVDAEAFTISMNTTLSTSATNLQVDLARDASDMVLTYDDAAVTLDTGDEIFSISPLTTPVDGSARTVLEAKVYVGYAALRQDLSDVGTIYSVDEAEGALGKLIPGNPLGMAVAITLANSTAPVKFVGVDSNDVVGYTAAKDRLENAEDIYAIVPLSQESEIISIFKAHAEQMSLPEVGKWRVCIGSTPLSTTETLQEGIGTLQNSDDNLAIVIEDSSAQFLSNSVDAGHNFEIQKADGSVAIYVVEEVIAEDMLLLDNAAPVDPADLAVGFSASYRIYKNLDKTQQAYLLRNTSASFASSRFVHVWPDICVIDDQELPGYYLACAVAGMTGGLASHQGFTRLSISGVGGLKHANDYFNSSQLDIIADGGTFIFLQSSPTAPPHVRHQLTTDMSTIEFREFSFVKNFDYVSYITKDVLDKFLGRYNINPSTLATLETALRATLESLRLYSLPRIGSPIIDFDVTSVEQLDSIRDRVEMYAEIDFPYALNTIGLHLVSR